MPRMVTITARRLRALERAEKTCRQMRTDICRYGGDGRPTQRTYNWLMAWMRLAGLSKFVEPGPAPMAFPDRPQDKRA